MKQQLKIFIAIFLLLVVAMSCEKLIEPTPQFNPSNTTFTLTAPAATVSAPAADSLKPAITFTWNDANLPLGLAKTKYTLLFDKAGNNFLNPTRKEFTGVLSGALLGKEVNGIALKYGGNFTAPANLDVRIIASLENNNASVVSNTIKVAFTPYSDLEIKSSVATLTATGATADNVGINLTWTTAFSGYVGVKTYQLQYAKKETNFASPSVIDVTTLSKSFTVLELNKIALGYGASGATPAMIDFRIKATNESGTVLYSNTTTVSVTTYVEFNSIGVVGDATAGGWDTDTDMYRPDAANKPADWTVKLYLTGGKSAKFRADDKWVSNWGATAFPSGTAVLGSSANVAIGTSGYYSVDFNVATGAYSFTPITVPAVKELSLTGDAIGGWGVDTKLTQDLVNTKVYTGTVTLTLGSLKFRETGNWGTNWGGIGENNAPENFPTSFGRNGGGDIKILTAATYFVRIDIGTGEYFFGNTANSTPYTKLGIIGDATAGAWNTDTFLIQNPSNPYKWSGKVELTAKEAKFRANTDWGLSWGNASVFPSGIANTESNNNIKIASAGTYQITYNSATREFSFTK